MPQAIKEAIIKSKHEPFERVPNVDMSSTLGERLDSLAELPLDPETHDRLAGALDNDTDSIFAEHGLYVAPQQYLPAPHIGMVNKLMPDKRHAEGLYRVDFAPDHKNDFQPGNRTSNIVAGLHAMEDYVTLVDAGVLPKPDIMYGYTNERMAKFAERAGFKRKKTKINAAWLLVADFDDVKEAVNNFDPRLKKALAKRALRQSGVSPNDATQT